MPEPTAPTIEVIVDQFVRLRDKLKEADDAHKERTKDARSYLEMLNGQLLERLQEIGGDSVKTPAGTVYRSTRKSATIADGDAFRRFVIGDELWDLVDWRANANAVGAFVEGNDQLPPGINYSVTYTVGVRRPTTTKE